MNNLFGNFGGGDEFRALRAPDLAADHHPDAEAVVCGQVRSTYPVLDDHSDRLTAALTEACFRKTPA
ncbi:hypothetical protein ACWD00_25415 [Streptomyces viridiviolaceus]